VHPFGKGAEAAARRLRPNAVLTDHSMPDRMNVGRASPQSAVG
jgi:hypothetical protein